MVGQTVKPTTTHGTVEGMSSGERSVKTYKAVIVALAGAVVVLLAIVAQMSSQPNAAAPTQATATATVTVRK